MKIISKAPEARDFVKLEVENHFESSNPNIFLRPDTAFRQEVYLRKSPSLNMSKEPADRYVFYENK